MTDASLLTDDIRRLVDLRSPPCEVRLTPRLVERTIDTVVGMEWEGEVREGQRRVEIAVEGDTAKINSASNEREMAHLIHGAGEYFPPNH